MLYVHRQRVLLRCAAGAAGSPEVVVNRPYESGRLPVCGRCAPVWECPGVAGCHRVRYYCARWCAAAWSMPRLRQRLGLRRAACDVSSP